MVAALTCLLPLVLAQPGAAAPQARPADAAPQPVPAPAPAPAQAAPAPAQAAPAAPSQPGAAAPAGEAGGAARRDGAPGADEQARLAQEQTRLAQEQARVAQQRAAQLDAEMQALQGQLEAERQRVAALEQQVAEERARQQRDAAAPAQRSDALDAATLDLARAQQAMAGGSSDVAGALTQAQALAHEVARNASTTGSPQEAALASQAQQWLATSQEALRRGDLFQARQAVDAAVRATQQARALAAAGSGAAAGGAGRGY